MDKPYSRLSFVVYIRHIYQMNQWGLRPSGLGEIDELHDTIPSRIAAHLLSTCELVNRLEGLSLPRISGMSDHPFI